VRQGRRGRGERARVERRVREILGNPAAPAPLRPTRHRAPNAATRLIARAGIPVDASRSAAVAVVLVLVVVAVAVAVWVMSSRPKAVSLDSAADLPIATRASSAPPSPHVTSTASSSATVIVVDVAGKVRRPGIYRLRSGARVDDALRAAGGPLPGTDLTSLNLAAVLADGQQVAVGVSASGNGGVGGIPLSGAASGPVHLNTATVEQLEVLPGVGPVLAQHIVDYRTAHGRFSSVDQLNDVPGIGDAKFAALRDAVAL
jgi:competence protein ComEA